MSNLASQLRLRPKQITILDLLCKGWRNKQIADQMGTTEQVIKNSLGVLYDKTGMSNRLELALWWNENSKPAPPELCQEPA